MLCEDNINKRVDKVIFSDIIWSRLQTVDTLFINCLKAKAIWTRFCSFSIQENVSISDIYRFFDQAGQDIFKIRIIYRV
jgi:hypothetical protein